MKKTFGFGDWRKGNSRKTCCRACSAGPGVGKIRRADEFFDYMSTQVYSSGQLVIDAPFDEKTAGDRLMQQ
jgi:hypothetical protein